MSHACQGLASVNYVALLGSSKVNSMALWLSRALGLSLRSCRLHVGLGLYFEGQGSYEGIAN